MKLYKNVTRTLLAVKTPRRIYIEPGMVIDVDSIGDITHSDVEMFINRKALIPVKERGVAANTHSDKHNLGTTEAVAVHGGAAVIQKTVDDDVVKDVVPEHASVHKSVNAAAVVEAPLDTPLNVSADAYSPGVRGEAFNALPEDIKDKISVVEEMVNKNVAEKGKRGRPKSKK